jgi:hypothetical protein
VFWQTQAQQAFGHRQAATVPTSLSGTVEKLFSWQQAILFKPEDTKKIKAIKRNTLYDALIIKLEEAETI